MLARLGGTEIRRSHVSHYSRSLGTCADLFRIANGPRLKSVRANLDRRRLARAPCAVARIDPRDSSMPVRSHFWTAPLHAGGASLLGVSSDRVVSLLPLFSRRRVPGPNASPTFIDRPVHHSSAMWCRGLTDRISELQTKPITSSPAMIYIVIL